MYPNGENLRKWYSYIIAPLGGNLDIGYVLGIVDNRLENRLFVLL